MKPIRLPLVVIFSLLAALSIIPLDHTQAQPRDIVIEGFLDPLNTFNNNRWHKANGWTNGDPFNCGWQADNANIDNGLLTLRLDDEDCPSGCNDRDYASGEYRTNHFYHYGYFETRLKAASADGTVTSFFIYTGPTDGNPHDEIDIEILGKNTWQIQINYYALGTGGHEQFIDLGFDAAAEFHTYGFEWAPDAIHWYVDGVLVHTEDGSNGSLPAIPGRIMVNFWPGIGVDDWLKPFTYTTPLESQYDWIRYQSPSVIFLPHIIKGSP